MYALINKNKFLRWVDLKKEYPSTCFPHPITPSDLPEGVVIVEMSPQPENSDKTKIVEKSLTPLFENGTWKLSYNIRDMNQEELERLKQSEASNIRLIRDELLKQSDWTQFDDSPVDKNLYTTYRQNLRDITKQESFPLSVMWPNKPD